MALNLASGLQVSAHFFWNRRNAAALSHHGVRMEFDPGAAPARVADSRLHLRAARRRVDVRAVLVQARRTGRPVDDPGRPGHRRDLRSRRRPAASRDESGQRAVDRRAGEQPDLRQGQRDRQVPAGSLGRHRGGAGDDAAAHRRQLGVDGVRHRAGQPERRAGRHRDRRTARGRITGPTARTRRRPCWPSTTTRRTSSGTASGR